MSITFDYVSMPPKSQEVSQIQLGEMNRFQGEHQEIASQFQEAVQKKSESTIRREKAKNDYVKEENREGKKRQKKQGNSSNKDDSKEQEEKPMHFDMRI